ncbi:MAG: hypothetical protein R3279_02165 [Putridiphycobacter sp.]|nr:hypothetical protein [Putridiphycobacter sp.]
MKLHLLSLLFLFTITSIGQVSGVIEGKPFARSKTESFNGFVGETNLEIYTVDYIYSNKKKKELITRKFFKTDLSITLEQDIFNNPLEENYYSDPYEILLINNKIYLFSIFTHIKEQTTTLGLQIYNEALAVESFEIIDSIANKSATNITIQVSEDKEAILISQNHPHNITSKEAIDLICLDLNGQSLWKKQLVSFNTVSRVNVEKIVFPSVTEVFLLCNYGFNNNRNADIEDVKLLTNKYAVWAYNHDLNFLKEIDLRLKLKWLNGVDIALRENGHLLISGFVNSSRDFAVDAVFNVLLNKNYNVIQNNYYKLNEEDLSQFINSTQSKRQLDNYFLRNLVPLSDGSFYLVGEHYYTFLDRIYDPRTNTTSTTEHFNYEDIIIAYFDKNGKIQWLKKLPKIQNSTNDNGYYSSFSLFSKNNSIYLIYNDNVENLELSVENSKDIKPLFNGRRNALMYAKVDAEGEMSRNRINLTENNYLLYAKKSLQVSNENMYLLTELGRKAKIIGLTF